MHADDITPYVCCAKCGSQDTRLVNTVVVPLKSKTMTLNELRKEVLSLCKKVRKQFNRKSWQDGLLDDEFLSKVIEPLVSKIQCDIHIEKGGQYVP